MAARAVGLATTGESLPPVASHASAAASAYHPPRGLLSIAASANCSPNLRQVVFPTMCDPYRHSLAMRPPRKVRPFCFFNYP